MSRHRGIGGQSVSCCQGGLRGSRSGDIDGELSQYGGIYSLYTHIFGNWLRARYVGCTGTCGRINEATAQLPFVYIVGRFNPCNPQISTNTVGSSPPPSEATFDR